MVSHGTGAPTNEKGFPRMGRAHSAQKENMCIIEGVKTMEQSEREIAQVVRAMNQSDREFLTQVARAPNQSDR